MSTWAQPGRLRRPGRGLKTEEKLTNSQFSKPPHTQNFGHPRASNQIAAVLEVLCYLGPRSRRANYSSVFFLAARFAARAATAFAIRFLITSGL